nr:L,D-transpeptidase family protein [Aureimonas flava]
MRPSPLDGRRGILAAGPLRLRCALGRSGVSSRKREGDGATPLAAMPVVAAYLRGGPRGAPLRLPGLPVRRARAEDGWCDAPGHPAYNRPVRLPMGASAETMRRADALYDVVVVLDWNLGRRARGLGSAIFLHVARPAYAPTEGCVAVSRRDMGRLAPFLRPGARLAVRR